MEEHNKKGLRFWFLQNCKELTFLDIVMGLIACMQLVLIVLVVVTVKNNHNLYQDFQQSINKQTELLVVESNSADSLCHKQITPDLSSLQKARDEMVEFESGVMKSNDYFTIILSLITLCATLAVVIPYIVGRSLSKRQAADMVEKEVEERVGAFRELDSRILDINNDALPKLTWAEAHLARMIAYLLANQGKRASWKDHAWSIGWASKSLIRYVGSYDSKKMKYGTIDFMNLCVEIIKDGTEKIKNAVPKNENLDKFPKIVERTFVDLFDAYHFLLNNGYIVEQLNGNTLQTLLDSLKAIKTLSTEERLVSIIPMKSQYKVRGPFADEGEFKIFMERFFSVVL